MVKFTDTTAADLYNKLCATIDAGLVDDFNKAFDANWATTDLENVASDAAAAFVDNTSNVETLQFLRNGIHEEDPATLDAFAAFTASEYRSPSVYMHYVARCYFYNKILDQYINNLTTFALIAAVSWVKDERWSNYKLCANSINAAAEMAAQGDAKPKDIAYTLKS